MLYSDISMHDMQSLYMYIGEVNIHRGYPLPPTNRVLSKDIPDVTDTNVVLYTQCFYLTETLYSVPRNEIFCRHQCFSL